MSQKEKLLLLVPEQLRKPLSDGDESWIGANGGQQTSHTFTLEYRHYTMHSILRAVLPPEIRDVPHTFETVGHIAHLNLREEQLPYKEVIGKELEGAVVVCLYVASPPGLSGWSLEYLAKYCFD